MFSYTEDPWIPGSETQEVRIRLIELEPVAATESRNGANGVPNGNGIHRPCPEKSEINCRIFWTSLKSPDEFKALSYTWGEPAFTQEITINGEPFLVTESLETALLHLRRPSEPLTLWIDQLCIDQSNDEEKAEQVRNMSHIYRAAEEVLVWLGPAVNHSDNFMDVWKTVGARAEYWDMLNKYTQDSFPNLQRILNRIDPNDPKTIEFTRMVQGVMPMFTLDVLEGLVAWYQRPWFKRVWVLQEFSLADRVSFVWGKKRVTADQAHNAHHILTNGIAHSEYIWSEKEQPRAFALMQTHDPTQAFFKIRHHRKLHDAGERHGDNLCDLFHISFADNRLESTLPCDAIYGLLGMAEDAAQLAIPVDYTLKDRTKLVYARTARAIIKNKTLEILALAQHPKFEDSIPSWVPDWTTPLEKSFAYQPRRDDMPFFSASKEEPLELIDTENELMLGLKGYQVDEIEEVAGIWEGAPDVAGIAHEAHITFLAQVRLLCRLSAYKAKNIYASHARRKEGLWRIPIGDIEEGPMSTTFRATSEFKEAHDIFLGNMEFLEQYKPMPEHEFRAKKEGRTPLYAREEPTKYRSCMARMKNKRPFMTKDGYVGLGPRYMRPGDIVAVFCGAILPYILRPTGGGLFYFIGECYCDGIMDGEIVEKREKEEFYLV